MWKTRLPIFTSEEFRVYSLKSLQKKNKLNRRRSSFRPGRSNKSFGTMYVQGDSLALNTLMKVYLIADHQLRSNEWYRPEYYHSRQRACFPLCSRRKSGCCLCYAIAGGNAGIGRSCMESVKAHKDRLANFCATGLLSKEVSRN